MSVSSPTAPPVPPAPTRATLSRAACRRALVGTVTAALAGATLAVPSPASAVPVAREGSIVAWGGSAWWGEAVVPASLADTPVTAVAAGGNHSLALTSDGVITGWGYNEGGQATSPSSLEGKDVTAIAAGWHFSMALTSDGKVTTWGSTPAEPPSELDDEVVTAIAGGLNHALALTSTGEVVAWGSNFAGETDVPASLEGTVVTAISANYGWSMALTEDGEVVTWGSGDGYHHGPSGGQSAPPVPDSLTDERVVAISAGVSHLAAATADGEVVTWGRHVPTALQDAPAELAGATITSLATPNNATYALTSDGTLVGWGEPYWGQAVPEHLSGQRVTAISATVGHALALTGLPLLGATGLPTIAGQARTGTTLTAHAPAYEVTPDEVTFQWFADGEPIGGATTPSLELTSEHVGTQVTLGATATKAGHAESRTTSAPVGPVVEAPVVVPDTPGPVSVRPPSKPKAAGSKAGKVYIKRAAGGVVLSGEGAAGATVAVRKGAAVVGTTTVDEQRRWSITVPSLRPGRHAFTATQTLAGRASAASAVGTVRLLRLKVRIAKVRPVSATRLVVRGRGNPGAEVVVTTGAGRTLGTTTVGRGGHWVLRTARLAQGTRTVQATQTIAAQTVRSASVRVRSARGR